MKKRQKKGGETGWENGKERKGPLNIWHGAPEGLIRPCLSVSALVGVFMGNLGSTPNESALAVKA